MSPNRVPKNSVGAKIQPRTTGVVTSRHEKLRKRTRGLQGEKSQPYRPFSIGLFSQIKGKAACGLHLSALDPCGQVKPTKRNEGYEELRRRERKGLHATREGGGGGSKLARSVKGRVNSGRAENWASTLEPIDQRHEANGTPRRNKSPPPLLFLFNIYRGLYFIRVLRRKEANQ